MASFIAGFLFGRKVFASRKVFVIKPNPCVTFMCLAVFEKSWSKWQEAHIYNGRQGSSTGWSKLTAKPSVFEYNARKEDKSLQGMVMGVGDVLVLSR